MIKKCLYVLSIMLTITFLSFSLTKLAKGDPAVRYLNTARIPITEAGIKNVRKEFGFDKPFLVQYGTWLKNAVKGDFGNSYVTNTPVLPYILRSFKSTLKLAFAAIIWIVVFSSILGLISTFTRWKWLDVVIQMFSISMVSMPSFWLGFLLIIFFALKLRVVPVSGVESLKSYFLPSLTLALTSIGQYTILIRTSLLEQSGTAHVKNAEIIGVKKKYIIKNHYVRNSLIPVSTTFILGIMSILTGSIVVEQIFSWTGFGRAFVVALNVLDVPVIQASLVLFGFVYIIGILMTNLIVRFLDPRISKKGGLHEKD